MANREDGFVVGDKPTVAILAVQGAFAEHRSMLERLGCRCIELRQAADVQLPFDALVLPGGESTVQSKLLHDLGMFDALRERIASGLPVLATCAGLILLAQQVDGDGSRSADTSCVEGFGTLPVTVKRNAYGRQLGSFCAKRPLKGTGVVPMTFIRAPRIERVGEGVEVLAEVDGAPVAVRFGSQIACAFHPELDDSTAIHEMLVRLAS